MGARGANETTALETNGIPGATLPRVEVRRVPAILAGLFRAGYLPTGATSPGSAR